MIKEDCGDVAISRSGVFERLKLIREDRERVLDDDHTGCPSTSKTDKNVSRGKNLPFNSDRRMRVKMIVDDLRLPQPQAFEDRIFSREENVRKFDVTSISRRAKGQSKSDLPGSSSSFEWESKLFGLGPSRLFLFPRVK